MSTGSRHPVVVGAVVGGASGAIIAIDHLIWRRRVPLVVVAVCDEAAHVATTLLLLAPFHRRLPRRFLVGSLVGSVAIDIDHLPMYAGVPLLTRRSARPVTHSLMTPAAAALWAARGHGASRPLAWGVTAGLVGHLLRDLTTGGVPLLWPWSSRTVRIGS